MTSFALETYQNEYLPAGGSDVHAVVTVTATGAGPVSATPATSAVVVIIDMSGSMQEGRKMASAKAAAKAAVDGLHDGVLFGVVAGNHDAGFVFPAAGLEMATDAVAAGWPSRRSTGSLRTAGRRSVVG